MPILGIMASQISGHLFAPAGAYDSLATVTLSATTASVTFAGIPAGYKHLQVRILSRSNYASTYDYVRATCNGDTGANYARHYLYGTGSAAGASAVTSDTKLGPGEQSGANGTANAFSTNIIDIFDYANVNKYKTVRTLNGREDNSVGLIELTSGLWMNTSAITTLNFYCEYGTGFVANSQFALYGVN
jgi:hypothetical protein